MQPCDLFVEYMRPWNRCTSHLVSELHTNVQNYLQPFLECAESGSENKADEMYTGQKNIQHTQPRTLTVLQQRVLK